LLLLAACANGAFGAGADDLHRRYLGAFSNVRISEASGDCSGVSVQLWLDQADSGKQNVSGILYDASGTCPGSKSDLAAIRFDTRSGKLTFVAKNQTSGLVVAEFRGVLMADDMHGRFGFRDLSTGEISSWSEIDLRRLTPQDWDAVGR